MKSALLAIGGFALCKYCQKRLGVKSNQMIRENVSSCYVCDGLMEFVKPLSREVVAKLEDYDYDTFLVGASVPHKVLDNEDELRSRLKIKGRDGIKSQITKMLSLTVKQLTGKTVNYSKPDATVLVSMVDQHVTVNPRSLWLSGRYVKLVRGLQQRSTICPVCSGLGCAECDYKGKSKDSVQARITGFLMEKFGADDCNFVWLGSEDENSLVDVPGRPFYVEVMRPAKRFAMRELLEDREKSKASRKKIFFRSKEIEVREIRQIDHRVTDVPQFEIVAKINLRRKEHAPSLDDSQVSLIEKDFDHALVSVRLSRKLRTVRKEVYEIKCSKMAGGDRLELTIRCDGGIPLKKLVACQDDAVDPNLSARLSCYEVDREQPFDILDVKVRGEATSSGKKTESPPQRGLAQDN